MARIVKVGKHLQFFCPGCNRLHEVNDSWYFNGDTALPTLHPSVLVQGTEDLTEDEYQQVIAGIEVKPRPLRCHSFVKDGCIQFLRDCTHRYAGKTIQLPEVV